MRQYGVHPVVGFVTRKGTPFNHMFWGKLHYGLPIVLEYTVYCTNNEVRLGVLAIPAPKDDAILQRYAAGVNQATPFLVYNGVTYNAAVGRSTLTVESHPKRVIDR